MNEKHLIQLRKFSRILYVCGASLLLAAMVLSMVNLPVAADDFTYDSFPPNSRHDWCHCMPNPQNPEELKCNTLWNHTWVSIWNGHIDASGNNYHEEDYYGPCVVPTADPTQEPTPDPTQEPTPDPTQEPTPDPTQEPTPDPTQEPTPDPTQEPTPDPTQEPTPDPTQEPTPDPTQEPTPDPTQEPTQEPTGDPTQDPTEDPTQEPIQDPNPPAGVLIPVTGVEVQTNGVLLARNLTLNLGILFFGMAMVFQSVTYRNSKKK